MVHRLIIFLPNHSTVTSDKSKCPNPFLYALCCCCRELFAAKAEEKEPSFVIRKKKTFRRSSLIKMNDHTNNNKVRDLALGRSKRHPATFSNAMARAVAEVDGGGYVVVVHVVVHVGVVHVGVGVVHVGVVHVGGVP